MHGQDDKNAAQQMIEHVEGDARPGRADAQTQKAQAEADCEQRYKRTYVGVGDGKEQRTDENSPDGREIVQQAGKNKAAKEALLAERSDQDRARQNGIDRDRGVLTLPQNHL